MNSSKIKINLIYNVIYQILILIVPFITTPYISRILSPEGLGTYSVTTAIAKYFWLFALLGMSNYGNREIAKVKDDKEKLSKMFCSLFYLQMIVSMLSLIFFIIYCIFFGLKKYDIVILCQLPYVISAMFEISWFYYGMENFKFMVIRNTVIKLITAISVFVFVKKANDVWVYVLINSISALISQLCLWPPILKKIKISKIKIKEIFYHFKPVCILFISVLAVSIYTLMGKIMIELFSNLKEVGYYENTEKIMNICISIVGAIGAVMLPRVSYLMGKSDNKKINEYIDKSMKYIMILSLGISFGVAGIANEFSIVFFGEKFAKCGILISVISISIVAYSWENILRTQYLLPGRRDKIFVKGTIYAAIANFLVNIILIHKIGAMGAVIGTVVAQIVAATYQSIKVYRELPLAKYIKQLIPFIFFAAFMFAICKIIGLIFEATIPIVIMQIICGFLIYLLLCFMFLYFQRDALLLDNMNKIKRIFCR